ncbi:MAG: TetR/AcrR family transcriptional regulator [Candidatus Brocadiia bacterium]
MPGRKPEIRGRDPEASRRRLLEAGVEVFSERGLDGGSVSMIAAKAGINRRMLYHYFGSKEGLYQAALRHVYEQLSSQEVALADILLEVEELLERLIRAEYAFLAAHPQHVRLLTWENLRRGKSAPEANLASFKAPILEALRIALDRGQREGRFRADVDEKQLLISCLGLSFFYFSNQYTLGQALGFDLTTPEAIETRIRHVVSLLLDGIRERNLKPHRNMDGRRLLKEGIAR